MDDKLTELFKSYQEQKSKTREIARCFDLFIREFINSEFGASFENTDGFSDLETDRQTSTIRMHSVDEYGERSEIVIEIFSEGSARVTSLTCAESAGALSISEERKLVFLPSSAPFEVAGRILSAVVDLSQNHISDSMKEFIAFETHDRGHAKDLTK